MNNILNMLLILLGVACVYHVAQHAFRLMCECPK